MKEKIMSEENNGGCCGCPGCGEGTCGEDEE